MIEKKILEILIDTSSEFEKNTKTKIFVSNKCGKFQFVFLDNEDILEIINEKSKVEQFDDTDATKGCHPELYKYMPLNTLLDSYYNNSNFVEELSTNHYDIKHEFYSFIQVINKYMPFLFLENAVTSYQRKMPNIEKELKELGFSKSQLQKEMKDRSDLFSKIFLSKLIKFTFSEENSIEYKFSNANYQNVLPWLFSVIETNDLKTLFNSYEKSFRDSLDILSVNIFWESNLKPLNKNIMDWMNLFYVLTDYKKSMFLIESSEWSMYNWLNEGYLNINTLNNSLDNFKFFYQLMYRYKNLLNYHIFDGERKEFFAERNKWFAKNKRTISNDVKNIFNKISSILEYPYEVNDKFICDNLTHNVTIKTSLSELCSLTNLIEKNVENKLRQTLANVIQNINKRLLVIDNNKKDIVYSIELNIVDKNIYMILNMKNEKNIVNSSYEISEIFKNLIFKLFLESIIELEYHEYDKYDEHMAESFKFVREVILSKKMNNNKIHYVREKI